jgi:glutamate-1-semialdehyde 2,1-aminomutase
MATIRWLHAHQRAYTDLEEKARAVEESVGERSSGSFVRLGSMFKYFFRSSAPRNYHDVKECDTAAFRTFWTRVLEQGVFLPPSQFETNFLSVAHDGQDIEAIAAAYRSCR